MYNHLFSFFRHSHREIIVNINLCGIQCDILFLQYLWISIEIHATLLFYYLSINFLNT